MQAITDDLLDILASRFQAGTDGYGCRIEIGYVIPGEEEIGVEANLASLIGTVTNDPSNTQNWSNPERVNDGNDSTQAQVGFSFAPWTHLLQVQLANPATISSLGSVVTDGATDTFGTYQYWDGAAWQTPPGTWGPKVGNRRTITFTGGPITADLWRFGYIGTTGLHSTISIQELLVFGITEDVVEDTLGVASYQVSACSIDKSRRMTAAQADVEIPLPDGASAILTPGGPLITNAPIRVYQWYGDPANKVLVFTGSVDEIREGRDPRTVRIVARDMMKRLIVQSITLAAPQGADEDGAVRTTANYVYVDMDVDAILDDLLDKAGVPTAERDITPTGYQLDEFLGSDGASFAETIIGDDRLTGLTGYDMWADEAGVIHFGPALVNRAADSDTAAVPDYSYVVGDYTTGDLTSGMVTRLDRAVDEYDLKTRVKVRGSIAIAVPAWEQVWASDTLSKPVGIMYVPGSPTFIFVLDSGTKKIYRIDESDGTRSNGGIWPLYVGGDVTYPIGLSRDPADTDVFYVLEAPYWTTGSTSGNKIHKYDLSDGSHTTEWALADGQWTTIKSSSANLWLGNFSTDKLHKHSKTDGSSVASYTLTYADPQVNPTGIFVDGTTLGTFWYGKARFLLVDESDPTTVDGTNALGITQGKVSTAGTKILGGEINTATHDILYACSDALGLIWKFTLTEPDTDEVFSEVVDTELEDELGFLMSAADREHDAHTAVADHPYEIRRETMSITKLLTNRAQATETATRRLELLAHRQETLDVGTVGNPALQRNDLVAVDDPIEGIDAAYVIDTLRSNMDSRGFFMTLALLPYTPAF
jgi:hypothetical protein